MGRLLLLFCSLCIASSSCAKTLTLGVSAAFTGSSKALGIELYRGAKAYFDHINAQGGVKGYQIEMKLLDDGYNPKPAITNTIQFIQDKDIFLLFNYVGTPTVTRILPLLKKHAKENIYLFFPYTGANPQRKPPYNQYVFNLRASYEEETGSLVDNFLRIGKKKIAVFYQADAYGRSGWDGVKKELAKHKRKINSEATYRRGSGFQDSYQEQVLHFKKAKPDAIISVGAYAACAGFIRDARLANLNVPIANVSFVGSEKLLDLLTSAEKKIQVPLTNNLVNSQVFPNYHNIELPAVQEYRSLMTRYKPKAPDAYVGENYHSPQFSYTSFEGFLNAKLLVSFLESLPLPFQRKDILPTMEKMHFVSLGIGTPISFSKNDHQGLNQVYFATVKQEAFYTLLDWRELKG